MRFRRIRKKINWRHILTEILLIFIGINLAIWFNNWNTQRSNQETRAIAISKLKEEVQNNLSHLLEAQKANNTILAAHQTYSQFYEQDSDFVVSSPEQLKDLQIKYPDFYRVRDSIQINENLYRYRGKTFITLELLDLSQIAWRTTQTLNLSREISYECLYRLESTYLLQNRLMQESEKAAKAMQNSQFKQMLRVLEFMVQLDEQLQDAYQATLEQLDNC